MKCLRDKMATELFIDQNKWARSKSKPKKDSKKPKKDTKKASTKKEDSKKVSL